jgi:hypothetical protein
MPIIVKKEPDVHVTEGELARYMDAYRDAYGMYSGTPPSLEEYIRRQKKAEADLRATLGKGD